MKKVTIL